MPRLRILVLMLLLVHSARSRRRHFGGASSSSGASWSSDYSNSIRILDNGEVINVIPIPVMNDESENKPPTEPPTKPSISGKVIDKPSIISTIHEWRENKKVMNGEKLYKNDPRYYPCSAGFIHENWSIISDHVEENVYPYLPLNVNVTLICINDQDYGFSDSEYWIRDELGLKCLVAFWSLVLIGVIVFLVMRKTN